MDEEKLKKKRKKAAEGEGEKEHRNNWREDYASVEDIKAFLEGRLYFRHNVVTGRWTVVDSTSDRLLTRTACACGTREKFLLYLSSG